MSVPGTRKRALRLVTCFFVVFSLVLATLEFAAPRTAAAQDLAQVSLDGPYLVQDLNGIFDVSATLLAGDVAVSAISFEIAYDPAVIAPVLNTDPNEGLVDAPACRSLSGVAAVACGPSNPSGVVQISVFRASGAWTNASPVDLVAVPFMALGAPGTSILDVTVTLVKDNGAVTIPEGGVGIDSDVNIALHRCHR